jgi:AraC-like DNA-binding protein
MWQCICMNPMMLGELRSLIVRHAGPDSKPLLLMPNIIVGEESVPTPPCPHIIEPVFSVIAQGAKRMDFTDHSVAYSTGQYIVLPVEMPVDALVVEASIAAPFLGFGLTLRAEAITSLLVEAGPSRLAQQDGSRMAVNDLTDDLLDPIVRLLRLLDRPRDIPILGAALEREILWRLLTGPQGSTVRQIGTADSHVARVGRATRWLRHHFAETVRIEDVAEVAGMSVTSLHRHFRAITSLTPIQYQKQLRLHAARTRLMTAREDVAEVGFAVGYDSPSQFSREYRRLFGSPPGRDGAQMRANAATVGEFAEG